MKMNQLFFSIFALFLLALTSMAPMVASAESQPRLLDEVAIIVNDQAILASEIAQRLALVESQIKRQQAQVPPRNVLLPQLLERMVLEKIQNQLAERYQIQVTDGDINAAIERIAARQNMSLSDFLEAMENQNNRGMPTREQIRQELIHSQLQQRSLTNRIEVTEQEVDTFLASPEALAGEKTEFKVRHILIQLSERATPSQVQAKRQQALDIIESVRQSKQSFADAAIASSSDSFALKGGDMGWRRLSQIPSRFTKTILKMETGEISAPIRSPSGFHILFLENKRGEESILIERAKIEHILIKPNQIRSEDQARQLAADLRGYILDGRALSELARTFSDDPGSALNGGDLGWVSLDSLDETFATTARTIPLNSISQVFRSQFGYHILRVPDRRKEDMTQALAQNRALHWLEQRKFEEYLPLWLSEIRADAYVEYKQPFDEYKINP